VETVRRLVQDLGRRIAEDRPGSPFFGSPHYRVLPLERSSFRPIVSIQCARRLAFVDGGNLEVVGAPNFSIQVNRVAFSLFRGRERVNPSRLPRRVEFLSLTYSTFRRGEIFYDTAIFPVRPDFASLLPSQRDLSFSSSDRTVMVGTQRADIVRVASIARRFAEWSMAVHVAEQELERRDALVVDGTLQTAFTNEGRYIRRLYEVCRHRGVVVTGLSKTSRLLTDTGLSLLGEIQRLASEWEVPYEIWYLPVAEAVSSDHNAMVMAVKLHREASHIFRFEIEREQYHSLGGEEVKEILAQLAANSTDLSFPGYPYGLIDADMLSRVRKREVDHYRAVLLSEASQMGIWEQLMRHMGAVDAHQILNLLMGE